MSRGAPRKLSNDQALYALREMAKRRATKSVMQLARELGVTCSTLHNLRRVESYKDVYRIWQLQRDTPT